MDSHEPQQPQQQQHPPHGMMMGPNSYHTNMANTSPMMNPNSAAIMQNNRFSFTSMVASKPADSPYGDGSSTGLRPCGFNIEPAKKKRGRPRKYAPDGNIALGLAPTPIPSTAAHGDATGTPSSEPPAKRNRGRPPGSGKKQLDALGAAGVGFTPHVITVNVGEDIASKIMAFSQQGPRTVCILSANGAICNVTLRQPAMSGGTISYEGRFDIISLSGSFLLSEDNGSRHRTGGLSVSLAGSDGRVLGGGVAGMLTAATPVQVVVGSFIADGKKTNTNQSGSSSAPPAQMLNFGAPVVPASPSQGGSSESSDENGGSPLNRGPLPYNNVSQPMHQMPMYAAMGWPNSTMKMLPN